jgi:hypothetical protein
VSGGATSSALVVVTSLLGAATAIGGLITGAVDPPMGLLFTVIGLLVVLGGVLVSRRRAGWVVCAGAVLVCGWDGVSAGPVNVPDAALLLAAFAAVCSLSRYGRVPRLPPALVVAVAAFSVAYLLVLVAPPDPLYVAGRIRPGEVIDLGPAGRITPDAFANFVRLLLALVVMPILVTIFAQTRREARGLGAAYVVGSVLNAAFSLSDKLGVTSVSEDLRGFADVEGRQAGLTTHPNQLGLVAAMAVPLAFVVFRRRPTQLAAVLVLLGGIWVSGSRAALAAALLAVGLSLVIAGWRLRLAYGVIAGGVVVAAGDVLALTRFGAASRSDHTRSVIADQAVADFLHSPAWGIGPDYLQDAHVIYLQLLAGSGLLGFLGFFLLVGWALRSALRMRHHALFAAAGASLCVFLVAGIASNALLARYLYVPLGLICSPPTGPRRQRRYGIN